MVNTVVVSVRYLAKSTPMRRYFFNLEIQKIDLKNSNSFFYIMALIVNLTNNSKRWFVGGKKLQNSGLLDRHHVWRSHNPTPFQNFDFCEEKK